MGTCNLNNTFAIAGLCLCFVFLISAKTANVECPGPTNYYKEIGCTPVFKNSHARCPKKYNCDHLQNLPTDKCFINGHTYKIDEKLRAEDKNPCDIGCYCSQRRAGAEFVCAVVDCYYPHTPGCYQKRNATDCCGGIEVCPKKDEDRATCIVDGKTYRDGEYFQPAKEPQKRCFCGEGYTGKNVEPFCVDLKPSRCGTMLRRSNEVRKKCAPVYYSTESEISYCPSQFRCQNDKDVVIPSMKSKGRCHHNRSDMQCKFGNLTMNVGDELNQATNYDSVCVKCVCEVPPVPTCLRLSRKVCDPSKHPKF